MENKKTPKVVKAFPAPGEPAKAVRAVPDLQAVHIRMQVRKDVLRGSGLPDSVQPYGMGDDAAVIYGGNGTATVRHAVMHSFQWALSECLTTRHGATPEDVYAAYPAINCESTPAEAIPVIAKVLAGEITAEAGATELESITRNARPSLRDYPPSAELDADRNHATELTKALRKARAGKLLNYRDAMAITTWGKSKVYDSKSGLIQTGREGQPIRFNPESVLEVYERNRDDIS